LKAFRDGKRTDPTMAPMAMPLSDQDIADLAAFYGGLK
jgi:cytochrome c553